MYCQQPVESEFDPAHPSDVDCFLFLQNEICASFRNYNIEYKENERNHIVVNIVQQMVYLTYSLIWLGFT